MPDSGTCLVCDWPGPFSFVFQPRGYPSAMVRCPACRLVFQAPQPDETMLAESYYHDSAFTERLFGELRELTLQGAEHKLALLRGTGFPHSGGRLLDVGCSSGAWLEVAETAGMKATGVEVGAATSGQARFRGLDVRTGTLEACFPEDAPERFDLITFWDVLEHLPDPRRELRHAARLLAPGGMVAMTLPNVSGWYPQTTLRLMARRTGFWEYPELPVHLFDFSPRPARLLLARTGFEPVLMRTFPTPFRHYRSTTLSVRNLGGGVRGCLRRAAFEALRAAVYPAAGLCGRGNSLFLASRRRRLPS